MKHFVRECWKQTRHNERWKANTHKLVWAREVRHTKEVNGLPNLEDRRFAVSKRPMTGRRSATTTGSAALLFPTNPHSLPCTSMLQPWKRYVYMLLRDNTTLIHVIRPRHMEDTASPSPTWNRNSTTYSKTTRNAPTMKPTSPSSLEMPS